MRIKWKGSEEYNGRFSECVRHRDGHVERGILQASLRPLHPVNNAVSIWIGRSCTPDGHTRMRDYLVKIIHSFHKSWCPTTKGLLPLKRPDSCHFHICSIDSVLQRSIDEHIRGKAGIGLRRIRKASDQRQVHFDLRFR